MTVLRPPSNEGSPLPQRSTSAPGLPVNAADAAQAWQREMERAQLNQWFKASPTRGDGAGSSAGRASVSRDGVASSGLTLAIQAQLARSDEAGVQQAPVAVVEPMAQASTTDLTSTSHHHGASLSGMDDSAMAETTPANRSPHQTPSAASGLSTGALTSQALMHDADGAAGPEQQVALSHQQRHRLSLSLPVTPAATSALSLDVALDHRPEAVPADHPVGSHATATAPQALSDPSAVAAVERWQQQLNQTQGIRCHVQWQADGAHVWLGIDGQAERQWAQLQMVLPELRRLLTAQGETLRAVVCNGREVLNASTSPLPMTADAGASSFETLIHQQILNQE